MFFQTNPPKIHRRIVTCIYRYTYFKILNTIKDEEKKNQRVSKNLNYCWLASHLHSDVHFPQLRSRKGNRLFCFSSSVIILILLCSILLFLLNSVPHAPDSSLLWCKNIFSPSEFGHSKLTSWLKRAATGQYTVIQRFLH